jgi:hypothetical protein
MSLIVFIEQLRQEPSVLAAWLRCSALGLSGRTSARCHPAARSPLNGTIKEHHPSSSKQTDCCRRLVGAGGALLSERERAAPPACSRPRRRRPRLLVAATHEQRGSAQREGVRQAAAPAAEAGAARRQPGPSRPGPGAAVPVRCCRACGLGFALCARGRPAQGRALIQTALDILEATWDECPSLGGKRGRRGLAPRPRLAARAIRLAEALGSSCPGGTPSMGVRGAGRLSMHRCIPPPAIQPVAPGTPRRASTKYNAQAAKRRGAHRAVDCSAPARHQSVVESEEKRGGRQRLCRERGAQNAKGGRSARVL